MLGPTQCRFFAESRLGQKTHACRIALAPTTKPSPRLETPGALRGSSSRDKTTHRLLLRKATNFISHALKVRYASRLRSRPPATCLITRRRRAGNLHFPPESAWWGARAGRRNKCGPQKTRVGLRGERRCTSPPPPKKTTVLVAKNSGVFWRCCYKIIPFSRLNGWVTYFAGNGFWRVVVSLTDKSNAHTGKSYPPPRRPFLLRYRPRTDKLCTKRLYIRSTSVRQPPPIGITTAEPQNKPVP